MQRTFRLVSPLMSGKDVLALQKALSGKNPWKKNLHPGVLDGKYGKETQAAVVRAKYFLGYLKQDGIAQPEVLQFLTGNKALGPVARQLQLSRARRGDARKTMRLKALQSAKDKRGLTEKPNGSNKNWLVSWWYASITASAAWCNISVSHSYLIAGSKAFKRGVDWAYVPNMEHAALEGNRGLAKIALKDAEPGDIITYNFDGGVADHTGILSEWTDRKNLKFVAEEGNTDAKGGAEGNEQGPKDRTGAVVSMAIRVLK